MSTKVKKITNVSSVLIPLVLTDGTTVHLPPRESIENVEVENYPAMKRFTRAELDLQEVAPKLKGKQKLNG